MPTVRPPARGRGTPGERVNGIGRTLILFGGLLVFTGIVAIFFQRMNIPLGRLPGDLVWRGRGWFISFPLVTCLIISAVLSLLLWLGRHLR